MQRGDRHARDHPARGIRRALAAITIPAAALVAVACGDGGSRRAADGTTPATASANVAGTAGGTAPTTPADALVVGPAEVGPIVWTEAVDPTTKAPTAPTDAFAPDAPALYAAIPVRNLRQGAALSATWTYSETSLDGLASALIVPAGVAEGWVEFHLARMSEEPWPDGTYAIAVLLDGQPAQTAEVTVRRADRG